MIAGVPGADRGAGIRTEKARVDFRVR